MGLITAAHDPLMLALSIPAQVPRHMCNMRMLHEINEQHACVKQAGDVLQLTTIVHTDQTVTADVRCGSKEDEAHAQHI